MPTLDIVSTHLLESKFQPQLGARSMMSRSRLPLPRELTHGAVKLVSVIAATGYGKSTLMAQWFAQASKEAHYRCAWLSLDENDNDPARMLRYLFGALAKVIPNISADLLADVARTISPSVLLEEWSIRLLAQEVPAMLFVDDVHFIVEPETVRMLVWLARQAGPKLRFVVGSRQSIGVGLADMRLRGQLIEIDQRAIAFNADEARQFCDARLSQLLDTSAFGTLLQKTEGWPAAMELLTLALNDAPDAGKLIADFATSERGVFEYLGDVVFGRIPAVQRRQLHHLAQFDRICADLAGVVCQDAAPDVMLADLQRRHLFLTPLDRQGHWFRFHHLVGDYLRRHAPVQSTDVAHTLTLGGKWYFEKNMIDEAIDCVVRAKNWDLACEWLLKSAEDVGQRQGMGVNLLRWVPLIPHKYLDAYPQIRLSYLYCLAFKQNFKEVEAGLNALEDLVNSKSAATKLDAAVIHDLRSAIPTQRMLSKALCDNAANLLEETEAWLTAWPNARARFRCDVLNLAAFACKTVGDIDKGLDYCARGRIIQLADLSYFSVSWNYLISGMLFLKRGTYRDAETVAHERLQFTQEHHFDHPEHHAYHQTIQAAVRYEFDDIAGATQALDACPDSLDDIGVVDFIVLKYLTIARMQFHAGQSSAGLNALRLGRKLGQRRHLTRLSASLSGEECIWLCRLGNHAEALELARQQGFDRSLYQDYDVIADKAARVGPRLLMNDHPDMAAAQLRPALERATAMNFHHRRVELLVLQAAALLRCGQTNDGLGAWQIALEVSERFGYRRVLLDDATLLAPLIEAARLKGLPVAPAWLSGQVLKVATSVDDSLTVKELRILRQLETGASNREIAESFFISEGTLKWHLHNIYRKLECKNRSGAIAAARKRSLL
jgi:ATP/maltotriose-dependent transcriptional regulator MalT